MIQKVRILFEIIFLQIFLLIVLHIFMVAIAMMVFQDVTLLRSMVTEASRDRYLVETVGEALLHPFVQYRIAL